MTNDNWNKHVITPFGFYCQHVLPLIYDQSLSYYEVLCKIQAKLNEVIKTQNDLQDTFQNLLDWINTQLETYAKEQLIEWKNNGTLESIINKQIFGELNNKVNNLQIDVEYLKKRIIHMKDYVIPDGNTDNTEKMQQAINEAEGHILYIDGANQPYRCNQLTLKSNSIYYCEPSVTIKANDTWVTDDRWQDPLIDIRLVDNVKWYGNGALITMNKPATLETEHAHCMGTRGATNIFVEYMRLMNASGDGFYLDQYDGDGSNKPSSFINLKNIICDGNGRNGMSLVSCHDVSIEDCTLTNTKGTAPQMGINIEAEMRSPDMTNIYIRNCKFKSNGFTGFGFAGSASNPDILQTVYVDGCTFESEPTAIYVNGIKENSKGNIIISNCDIRNSSRNAILDGNNSNSGIKRTYVNCISLNANSSNRGQRDDQAGEWGWACAFQVYANSRNCGNVRFINCVSDDNRTAPLVKTAFGLTRASGSSNVINLVEIIGCYCYHADTSLLSNFNALYNIRVDETLPRNKLTPVSAGTDFINARNYYCTIQGGIIYINSNTNLFAEIEARNINGNATRLRAGSGVTFGNGLHNVRLTNKGSFVRLATDDGSNYYIKYGNDYTLD